MMKWIIGLIVVIILGAALWWSGSLGKLSISPAPQAQTQQPPATPGANTNGLPTPTTDTSDSAISQDAAAVDAQIGNLGSDSTNVNQSIEDQSIQQSSL